MKNTITNEELKKRFDNPFTLVNYAISLAKVWIQKDEMRDSNLASDVLDLIASGHDQIEEEEPETEIVVIEEEVRIK